MKRLLCVLMVGVLLGSMLAFINKEAYRYIPQDAFTKGEYLQYRLHYGVISAGEAEITVDPKLYKVNDRICYHTNVNGYTTGTFDLFLRIRDKFGAYIDTSAIVPQKGYRFIQEGNFKMRDITRYDHVNNLAYPDVEGKEKKTYKIPDNVQELVSGYYYLRTIDYNKMQIGDTIKMNAFYEDSTYKFNLKYLGKTNISTKIGKFKAILLSPIMPENRLFKGENSIKFYISDDKNRIPLKVKAEMFVGAVEVDIKDYKGTRHPIGYL